MRNTKVDSFDEDDYIIDVDVDPTLCNRYPNKEVEYIFSVKGRPFGCLSSPHLPTPTSTLLDYNLVRDLGLKMYDLKYQKFTFCGAKMRILGKVHLTAQTIHDGVAHGAFHMKANVVLDLNKNVDCECVAGIKTLSQLEKKSCTSSGAPTSSSTTSTPRRSSSSSNTSSPSPKPTSPPTGRPSPKPPQARTSAFPSSARPSAPSSPRPISPPGFPPQPQFKHPHAGIFKPKRPEISVSLTTIPYQPNPTILDANLYALSQAFNDADLLPTSNQEVRALLDADPGGRVEPGADNVTRFRTSGGLTYDFRHGRNRCVPDLCMLVTQDQMPHNCGYHRQWYRPYNFTVCGPSCPGSFCKCLEFY